MFVFVSVSVFVSVFVSVYMYLNILCLCICVYVFVYVYLYLCICICVFLYLCICVFAVWSVDEGGMEPSITSQFERDVRAVIDSRHTIASTGQQGWTKLNQNDNDREI